MYAKNAQQILDILNVWSPTAWALPPPFFHVLRFSGTPKVDEVNEKWIWTCEGGMSKPLGQPNVFKVVIEEWDANTDDSDQIELVQTTVRGASTSHDKMYRITIGAAVI